MDAEQLRGQIKQLKGKSTQARRAGAKGAASAFRAGMRRAQRRLKGVLPPTPKKSTDGD